MNKSQLNSAEKEFYARHLSLSNIGEEGQLRLKQAKVLLVGAGGLGSPMALYLAAAGVGKICVVDFDHVETSNLQRQILFGTDAVGNNKANEAERKLRNLNPYIEIEVHSKRIDEKNALNLISSFDVVADGSDNFPTRYLVNDACFFVRKPLVSASVSSFEGQLSVFNFKNGPCYRCLFPKPLPPQLAPSCNDAGVLGVVPGILGTMQANEVLKIILNIGEVASEKLIHFDALKSSTTTLKVKKKEGCSLCGDRPLIKELKAERFLCSNSISYEDFLKNQNEFILVDVRDENERSKYKLKDSIHIPLSKLEENLSELPSHKKIVFYCESGKRSLEAVKLLKNSKSLFGGMRDVANCQSYIN